MRVVELPDGPVAESGEVTTTLPIAGMIDSFGQVEATEKVVREVERFPTPGSGSGRRTGADLLPFGQVEGASTRSRERTGLGLPISRSLAHLPNGGLTVEVRWPG